MPTNYERGRPQEYVCIRDLKKLGMWAHRMAGSKGPFDILAFDNEANQTVIISVKSYILSDGEARSERRTLHAFKTPNCVRKELWMKGTRGWEVQVLNPPKHEMDPDEAAAYQEYAEAQSPEGEAEVKPPAPRPEPV